MKILTPCLALLAAALIHACTTTNTKEQASQESTSTATEETAPAQPAQVYTHPIEYFNAVVINNGEPIYDSEELLYIPGWDYTVTNFASTSTICAVSDSGEQLLFIRGTEEKKYQLFAITPTLNESIEFTTISLTDYETATSQSVEVFTQGIEQLDFDALQAKIIAGATNITRANDSLYIATERGNIAFLNKFIAETGEVNEGGGVAYYTLISQLNDNIILLARHRYPAIGVVLVNMKKGQQFALETDGFIHNLHCSPNGRYLALDADGGGDDSQYDPFGTLWLYDLAGDKPALIFTTGLGPVGKNTRLKWVGNEQVLLSTFCRNYRMAINGKTNPAVASAETAAWPFIAGRYEMSLSLAYDGQMVTGYYNNGRFRGDNNFGCSFYFYGKADDSPGPRAVKVNTLNPFALYQQPREGVLRLHSEEGDILSLVANLSAEECWDPQLGWGNIAASPGISFTLSIPEPWQEIRLVNVAKLYFYQAPDEATRMPAYVLKNDPLMISEQQGGWLKASFIGSSATTSGWIKATETRSLAQMAGTDE